jgi:transketolase
MTITREDLLADLRDRARRIRAHVIRMAGMSDCHTGGSLSMADLTAALYFHILRVDPQNPHWPGRDYFILSKGHTVPALDAALAMRGFFPESLLTTHLELDSLISGHASTRTPGIEVSTGSLGHGLSVGVGAALGLRASGADNRVFVLLGDGELQEGSNWEAAMCAAHHHLDRLTAVIDRNWYQTGATEEMLALEPLADKWRSFGWGVRVIDGHDMAQIVDALEQIPYQAGRPSALLALTRKGQGVSFIADGHCHMNRLTTEQERAALAELGN